MSVELPETAAGATITYRTDDVGVVQAIHDWLAAPSSDHGDYAEHGSS
jgi:hypothetical protein